MLDFLNPGKERDIKAATDRSPINRSSIHRRLSLLQVLVPIGLLVLVVVYEFGPAHWILESVGIQYHYLAEILFYGTIGPILAWVLLHFVSRWLEERETSDLQAQVLAQAKEFAETSRQLNDEAMQAMFAIGVHLAALKSGFPDLTAEEASILGEAEKALDQSIQKLRSHLSKK